MSQSNDLERIDVPWRMALVFLLLAGSLVLSIPAYKWVSYTLAQTELDELVIQKAEDLSQQSASLDEGIPRQPSGVHPILLDTHPDKSSPKKVLYYRYEICPDTECGDISFKKVSRGRIPFPSNSGDEGLQAWSKTTCKNIHETDDSLATGTIITRDKLPIELLCAVANHY
ncbi:MAG: hypothetical protein KDK33_07955 [Leptospiraceae bacterium]|nr:hypothetical protein [Leptospiraceae bacterium]